MIVFGVGAGVVGVGVVGGACLSLAMLSKRTRVVKYSRKKNSIT